MRVYIESPSEQRLEAIPKGHSLGSTNPHHELNPAAKRLLLSAHPVYDRPCEHAADALLLLERLRQAARDGECPSTAELQAERVYGLRPVNRIGDLVKGKYNRTRYDIERIARGHGVFRWRLHEPSRPGYPKNKKQNVLLLTSTKEERREHGPRPSAEASELPLFSRVRW